MRRVLATLLALAALALGAPAAHAVAPDPAACDVADARLDWGFKESFRAYIDGSIANGEWTVAEGATYETPLFSWHDGVGQVGENHLRGDIAFPGSVRFTGHGGILDTTIANPVVSFDASGHATLLLDVSGPTMEGDPFSAVAVPFADLDLTPLGVLTRVGDVILVEGAAATLTADGAEAFPNYPAGSELDPVTLEFTVAASCEATVGEGVIGDATPFVILVAVLAGLLVAVAIVLVVLAVRRRR